MEPGALSSVSSEEEVGNGVIGAVAAVSGVSGTLVSERTRAFSERQWRSNSSEV